MSYQKSLETGNGSDAALYASVRKNDNEPNENSCAWGQLKWSKFGAGRIHLMCKRCCGAAASSELNLSASTGAENMAAMTIKLIAR